MIENGCETFLADCNVRTGAALVGHQWDPVVLTGLRLRPTRRSVLIQQLTGASDKVVTESLRRLVARGLVARLSDEAHPGSAVYALTPLGRSFAEGPLIELARWAADHQDELAGAF